MIGQTILHYRILEKLGEGGMGIVYKAQDLKLERIVALKFLPHHLSTHETERARFIQEAKAASTLNHPNVCTIYDIQEFDDPALSETPSGKRIFIVMEYIDGGTLRELVPFQKLDDALSYAIQVGEALQEAHRNGIVHRDIKSENIMVNSKHQIKVMDFGLAKLKGSMKLTKTSSTVGTLAYMAPEQIQGGEVDERSDIFSFGVVLFEMLTGRTPFRGDHEAALMYSIVNEEPEPLQKYRPDLTLELGRIVRRALEKDPTDRYQHIDDMISELRRLRKQSTRVIRKENDEARQEPSQPQPGRSSVQRKKPWLGIVIGAVAVALAIFVLVLLRNSSPRESSNGKKMLVVLPFENLGSSDQEYFADGMTEEITSRLSGLSGFAVIARSSAMQYKKTSKPIQQIGNELGVSYILQGTVRWENVEGITHVRVTPQLINVADGTQIWSQPSEAVLASVFKIQSEIAGEVASALNITLLQNEKQSLEATLTDNAEAYDYYLRGNDFLHRSTREGDYRIAEQMFERAVELDPKFATAYARLGGLHSHLYWELYDHTEERARKSKEAAEKALELAPDLPDAHGAMGWYYYHCRREYDNAIKEFNLALSAQPNNVDLLLGLGSIYRRRGKFDDALTYFKRAQEIDPRSAGLLGAVGETEMYLRKYDDEERYINRALIIAPDAIEYYFDKALLYLQSEGNITRARQVLNEVEQRRIGDKDPYLTLYQTTVDIMDGAYQQALERLLSTRIEAFPDQYFYLPRCLLIAQVYGYLGQQPKAFEYYDSARVLLVRELKKYPDDGRFYSSLGIAYAGMGRKAEAIQEGKHGMDILPISQDALIGPIRVHDLAEIYAMVGEPDSASALLEQLLSIPSEVSSHILRLDPVWKPLAGNSKFQKLIEENN